MALYEHVFISRQDLSSAQAEGLVEHFTAILKDNGGNVLENEYWGLKTMKSDAPSAAVQEMERLMRLHDDVMRIMTIKVDAHEDGPSAVVQAKNSRDDRGPRRPRREF